MERRAIAVRGTVQGVGFRPFVYGLATRLDLRGFVLNHTGGVRIEVEGETARLDQFLSQLTSTPPPLARIDELSWERQPPRGDRDFRIEHSEAAVAGRAAAVVISPDVATCDDCLRELFDPQDRRYRYPFLNCTNCGPRLTIVMAAPYDRERTTMAGFAMCHACRAEYEDPADRRFHAQPTACATCGPRLALLDARGVPVIVPDPLAHLVQALRAGKIGVLKGLGGYLLACDAQNEASVAELRRRKHRDEKPFAIMVRDLAAAMAICHIEPREAELLTSAARPIVLLRKLSPCHVADAVSPRNVLLGIMLPYTPLHHLLLHDLDGMPLVMTSGNRSDEPIAYRDDDAVERLRGIADLFLVHDRPIHVRCDDSVTRVIGGQESPIRRSRGYAPRPLTLPISIREPILAVGGQLKATFALGRDRAAILSHHLGDLDHYQAYQQFERDIELYQRLFEVRPACIAHDLHPDYASTRYAQRRAAAEGIPCIAVQHHHAHMASCMAEHRLAAPVIGVTFDGTGYGTDGTVWGGEFLVGDYLSYQRAARLRTVRMPGGDAAIREPWRMAMAHLLDAGCSLGDLERRIEPTSLRTIDAMIQKGFNAPWTSSAGRLFDAVAAIAGMRDRVSYEGQAAVELEALAAEMPERGGYPFEIASETDDNAPRPTLVVDTRPLIAAVAEEARAGTAPARIARRFHSTLTDVIASVCSRVRDETGIDIVVLSGGVFLNALLAEESSERLTAEGLVVYRHVLVPPNDGGISLGQLAVAAAQRP